MRQLSVALLVSWISSCLWYPVHAYNDQHRGQISRRSLDTLVTGKTTREDTLCELGEPDWASKDERRLAYWTHESTSNLVVWLIVDLEGVLFGKDRYLALEFDADGRLLAMRKTEHSFSQSDRAEDRRPAEKEFEALFNERPHPGAYENDVKVRN